MRKYIVIDENNNVIAASEGAYIEIDNATTIEIDEEINYDKFEGLVFDKDSGKVVFDEVRYLKRMSEINKENLRLKREDECFSVVNRGDIWYETYVNTPQREREFKSWYKAWLDVTETLIIPTKPSWIK